MRLWWLKASTGFVVGLLLGCTTPPGEIGKSAASVTSGVLVPGQVVAPAFAEPKVESNATPVLALSPTGVAAATTNSNVQVVEPVSTIAPVSVAQVAPWTQRGRASWYGHWFNGRRTANGERFNAMALTAAHRTLPMPSFVRVRVVGTGKEVVVRINDRGPFHGGRVIDLSYAAARKLGILTRGSVLVDITLAGADVEPDTVDADGATTQGAP